jgi:hypothetical protein
MIQFTKKGLSSIKKFLEDNMKYPYDEDIAIQEALDAIEIQEHYELKKFFTKDNITKLFIAYENVDYLKV